MQCLEWLANIVVVKKKNMKNWVCVNFTDLNKARLNVSFPLSLIDQLVDVTAWHEVMIFLDAFSGYN